MISSNNITLLYEHPHAIIEVIDNTGYQQDSTTTTEKALNGIQVGFFAGGRDNELLYIRSTAELINEFGDLNHKLYGQSGYNAYNALDAGAGMYVMRLTPANMTHANTVIMAKYKLIDDTDVTPPITGNDVAELIGTNPIQEMIPDEENADTTKGMAVFTLSGKVASGLTGDTNVDGLFSHINSTWLEGNNLGNFTIASLKIPVPAGTIVGDTVTIQQTSGALKKFYTDFGEDPDHINQNEDGVTATKTREYDREALLEGNNYFTLCVLVAENDTIYLDVTWNKGDEPETIVIKTSGLTFTKPEDDTEEEKVPQKLAIKFGAVSIENATGVDKIKAEIAKLYSADPDKDGWVVAPLMAFWALGRGCYGQNLRIKLADGNNYEGTITPTSRTYRIDVLENSKAGLTRKEYAYGLFDEDAYDENEQNGPSLYISDVVNDVESGSGKINMYFNTTVFDSMIKMVNSLIENEEDKMTVSTFDPILGLNPNGTENQYITIIQDDEKSEDYINLLSPDGFNLLSGSDGDFDTAEHSEQEIAEVQEKLLIDAFAGNVDKRIRSRYTTPSNFCLDANFSDNVKLAMAAFAHARQYDCMTYLDTKLYKTANECILYLKSLSKLSENNLIKEMHCYKYRDIKFTKKSCDMTITHWFAKKLVQHILNKGIGEPFAKDNAIISAPDDFISGSFAPVIDPDEHEIKAQIYKLNANCFESVKYNVYQRSTAITTYDGKTKSDRKDEFNEYIVQRAVKIIDEIINSRLYKLSEAEDRKQFTTTAQKIVSLDLAGLVRSCSVRFEMTKSDERFGILQLITELVFNTVSKYGVARIILNPRVTDDEL